MKNSVWPAFLQITHAWEGGHILWMFPDVKKLISGGWGLLLDPVALALTLPWKRPDGTLAGRDEIVAEWSRLKNYVESNPGSEFKSWKTYADKTTIRITPDDLNEAVRNKVAMNEMILRKGFPDYDEFPADAQLGILSMSWACGPAFFNPAAGRNYWPKLTAAIRSRDWRTASVECFMNEEARNPGIKPRNAGNRIMFTNAAIAQNVFDPEQLFYPTDLERHPVSPDDETVPELVPSIRPSPIEATTIVDFQKVRATMTLDELRGLAKDDDPDDAA